MKIIPKGARLLVDLIDLKKADESYNTSLIEIPEEFQMKAQKAVTRAKVIDMDSLCYKDESYEGKWCDIGDTIVFIKYKAFEVNRGKDKKPYYLISASDVMAVIDPDREQEE